MRQKIFLFIGAAAMLFIITAAKRLNRSTSNYAADSVEIKLPDGFTSTVFAENTGRARHVAVNSNGDVYIKMERLVDGKGILRLRDTNGDGRADDSLRFGDYTGTGIFIKGGYLYASSNDDLFRYRFNSNNEIENPGKPEKIITGLLNKRQHASKSFVLDEEGYVYVNIGAPSNACQEKDRVAGSKGMDPCPILDSAGGIWKFRADKLNQTYADGTRYATGLRNVVGLDWNVSANALYVTMHGRDQLGQFYPELYDARSNAELPSEEFFKIKPDGDYGWPYCYYDHLQQKKVLAPEYGGDGKITGRCDAVEKPIMAFPGHLGPNALLFYTGKLFPEKYKNGAFIAFHGSWNRAPEPQAGFYVVFVPFKDGLPSGNWEVFADGFAGKEEIQSPAQAMHRPCGLAQGPDGSIYVTDDAKGTVWKISYKQ